MTDLKLVKDTPCQVTIQMLEEALEKVKTGSIKGIILVTVDKAKHTDARARFNHPVTSLELAGSLRIAQHLLDKMLLGGSDPSIKSNYLTKIRKGNPEEVVWFIENKVPCFIAKVKDGIKRVIKYFVIPKEIPKEMNEAVILAECTSEADAREFCEGTMVPCDLKMEDWTTQGDV